MEEPFTLLTGATGFLGRYALRDLLASGRRVVALARGRDGDSAATRVRDALRWTGYDAVFQSEQLTICEADITHPSSLETAESQRWLSKCTAVIHSAADTGFVLREDGQPWKTNFYGTQHLFERVGPQCKNWLQVSTAYTSPVQNGLGMESLAAPSSYRNAYEESKHSTDRFLHEQAAARGMRLAIARPGIIVGEYATGKTCSYDGFYRPMQMLATLVSRADCREDGSIRLPLRYDIPPDGVRNLVPVDWVAAAIVRIAASPTAEGVLHLTPRQATTDETIDAVMRELWQIDGAQFVPDLPVGQHSTLEKLFYRSIHRVAPNWHQEPVYDTQRLNECLPDFPCPVVDHAAVSRILRYAAANDWGKHTDAAASEEHADVSTSFDCSHYLQTFLPTWAPQSALPRLENVTATIGFAIRGSGGGDWVCQMVKGDVDSVTPGSAQLQPVCFATDAPTFAQIVNGQLSTQHAFFKRKVEIRGDIETGLKLAMVFQQFVREFPYGELDQQEVECVQVV